MQDGNYCPPLEKTALVYDMYNEIGEADFSIPFYIGKLWNFFPNMKEVVFGVFSNDTDILYYCALQLAKMKATNNKQPSILSKYMGNSKEVVFPNINVIWRYYPSPNWVLYSIYPYTKDFRLVDIQLLSRCLNNDIDDKYIPPYTLNVNAVAPIEVNTKKRGPAKPKGGKNALLDKWDTYLKHVQAMNMPLENIILSLMVAGSDYTKGYYGITHETFFKSMILYYTYVGNLLKTTNGTSFSWNVVEPVDSAAYARLVKIAFMVSKPARYSKKKDLIHDTSVRLINPHEYDHTRTCAAVASFPSNKKHFPNIQFILSSYLHFSFYIKMVTQIGKNVIEEPCLLSHCYYKKYEDREWARDNTQKMFTLQRSWTIK